MPSANSHAPAVMIEEVASQLLAAAREPSAGEWTATTLRYRVNWVPCSVEERAWNI
jgi:hypothetical protein